MKKSSYRTLLLTLLAVLAAATPAPAATIEVRVRDGDGRALEGEIVNLRALSIEGNRRTSYVLRRQGMPRRTDSEGTATFEDLVPGTYVATVPRPRQPSLLSPRDNPLAPPPRLSIFAEDEHVTAEIELSRGFRVAALIELPDDAFRFFRALFRHRESGRVLASSFPRDANVVERLLVPGIWELEVEPKPGYLLVGVEREHLPLPGHTAVVDLLQEPSDTWVTWTYAAPAELTGVVVEATGKEPAVRIEATLVEPGPWHDAARRRGGSVFERVTARLDPNTHEYEMVLPDGVWAVRPVGSLLISSEPEVVERRLAPGSSSRADFTVRLDEGAGERPFVVDVTDEHYDDVIGAKVEVYALDDLETLLRSGVTRRWGHAVLPGLAKGDYLVVAGHEDYLEARLEVRDYDPRASQRRQAQVRLPSGAEVRLQAVDPGGEPLAEVRLRVERLGDPPETVLRDEDFLAAKQRRDGETDQSGRASLRGFYPGAYRVEARLGGRRGTRGLIYVGKKGGKLEREIEIDLPAAGTVDLEARMLPASNVRATLICADEWALPGAASARVVHARAAGVGEAAPEETALLALDDVPLTGRGRDTLEVGPLEQGVYRLALRPQGFDRWTWAFETDDFTDAAEIQVGVDAGAVGTVDLGLFQVECGPAVDLLPAVATGDAFPALHEVGVEARILDPGAQREIAPRPAIARRDGRVEVRGLPRGESVLEITLTHPHLLPEPSLGWRIEMALERGQFREIVPEVEALGGAIVVAAESGSAAAFGPDGEARRADARRGEIELPSLAPGRYRLELYGVAGGDEPTKVWTELEVTAGETLGLGLEDR